MDYYFHEPEFKKVKLSKNKKFKYINTNNNISLRRQISGNKEIEKLNNHLLIKEIKINKNQN